MKTVELTKGYVAIVDDEDYAALILYKWHAHETNGAVYAASSRVGLMHRFLLGLKPGEEVDHKDRNGLNNQRSNIRPATREQQMANVQKYKGAGTYKGVYYHIRNKGYCAKVGGMYIGTYPTAEEAALAYNKMALRFYGEFAVLNQV